MADVRLLPAEWEPHRAVWLAWPSDESLWQDVLPEAQAEFAGFCRAILGENLEVLVDGDRALRVARTALNGCPVRFHTLPYGDIWLRDTGPLFLKNSDGTRVAARFGFNGWGDKFRLPFDDKVSERIAMASKWPSAIIPWVLEGGSIESDGQGTYLTTEQCVLNPNRNPHMNRAQIEEAMARDLGARKVIWLGDGLINDHTDGHIDTLARYVAPGVVMCMEPRADDPNREALLRVAQGLTAATDAEGRKLRVLKVPSPGRVEDESGRLLPASHLNFYIANNSVVVPTYHPGGQDFGAVAAIARHFAGRQVIGCPAKAILSGGGAFHCISQQEPQ